MTTGAPGSYEPRGYGSVPEQAYCNNCGGGNPLGTLTCTWCGQPIMPVTDEGTPPRSSLLQSYLRVVNSPTMANFAQELPAASWPRVWVGLAIAAAASILISALADTLRGAEAVSATVGGLALAIGAVLGFFIGSLILYGASRLFGGRGRTGRFGPDFLTHSYLLSLVFVPFSIATDLLNNVPVLGSCLLLILSLYQLYLQYRVIQVSMQLDPGQAKGVIASLFAVGLLLGCVLFAVSTFYFETRVNNIFSEIGSGLK